MRNTLDTDDKYQTAISVATMLHKLQGTSLFRIDAASLINMFHGSRLGQEEIDVITIQQKEYT